MATPNIVPRSDSEGGLGTASKYWASAYIDTIITTGNVGVGTSTATRPITINSDTSHRAIRILENDLANESWDIGVDVDGDLNFFNSADSAASVSFQDDASVIFAGKITTGNQINVLGVQTGSDGAFGEIIFHNNGDSVATIASFRDGADTSGSLVFQTQNAGSFATALTLAANNDATFAANIALGGGAFNTTHSNVTSIVNLDDNASIFTRADETYIGQNLYYNSSDAAAAIETGRSTLAVLGKGTFKLFNTSASVSADATTSLQERFSIDTAGAATFAGDVDINGNLVVEDEIHLTDGGSAVRGKLLLNSSDRDNVELRAESLGSTMKFFTVGTEALELDASQNATFAGDVSLADSKKLKLGTGSDFQIYHSGSNAFIANTDGNINIINHTDNADIIFQADDGNGGDGTYFFLDGSSATYDSSTSATTALFTNWPDKSIISLGTSNDLQIFHDGSHSRIKDTGTGNLIINATDFVVNNAGDTKNMIIATDGGATTLFCDGTARIATTSTGVTVTGTLNANRAYTGTAEGSGIDATDAVSISVGEYNSEIITNIFVDIGAGSIISGGNNTSVIGNATDANAYITQITTAVNGIVYNGEMICLEAPTVSSGNLMADLDIRSSSDGTIASGTSMSTTRIFNSNGDHILGRKVDMAGIIAPDQYLYITQGATAQAGVYNAGKFLIRLYGAKVTGL